MNGTSTTAYGSEAGKTGGGIFGLGYIPPPYLLGGPGIRLFCINYGGYGILFGKPTGIIGFILLCGDCLLLLRRYPLYYDCYGKRC